MVDDCYEGLVHHADAAVGLQPGQRLQGFIKQVREDGKLDIVPGKPGYDKISGEPERIRITKTTQRRFALQRQKRPARHLRLFRPQQKEFQNGHRCFVQTTLD